MVAVFIAQSTLTQWSDAGTVRLDGDALLLVKEQRTVVLKPAVRFLKLVGVDADPHGLLGKVKTADQLRELGAEHYMDSVLLGEVAYAVVEGFTGDLQGGAPAVRPASVAGSAPPLPALRTASPAVAPAQVGAAEDSAEEADAEALSRLFLDTVR